jgi:hypothetical protein
MRALSLTLEHQVRRALLRSQERRARTWFLTSDHTTTPQSLVELQAQARRPQGFAVWTGGSDRTVWSSARANWRARAWHDFVHLELAAGFDLAGEIETARAQLEEITGALARRVQWVDTAGQQYYFHHFGAFPTDQRAFTVSALAQGVLPAIAAGPW